MARLPRSALAGQKDCPRAAPPLPHRTGVAFRLMLVLASGVAACTLSGNGTGSVSVTCDGGSCTIGTSGPVAPITMTGTTGTTVSISPASGTIPAGGRLAFTATVTPGTYADGGSVTDLGVVFTTTGGDVDSEGEYTAPAVPGTYYVVAQSTGDTTAQAVATITVKQVGLSVSPATSSVQTGLSEQLTASVTGSDEQRVAWSIVEGADVTFGTVDSSGVYHAPTSIPTPAIVHVRATSVADPSVQGEAQVTVVSGPPVSITVDPAVTTLLTDETLAYHAEVEGGTPDDVTWSIVPIDGGGTGEAMMSGNTLIAGPDPAHFYVQATSKVTPDRTATGEVFVVSSATQQPIQGFISGSATGNHVMIAGAGYSVGAATRVGDGLFHIHGWDPSTTWPQDIVAWVDDGSGAFLPALDPWGVETLTAEPSADSFAQLTLATVPPFWGVPDYDSSYSPGLFPAGTSSLLVVFDRLTFPSFGTLAVLPDAVDSYDVQLSTTSDFSSGVTLLNVAAGSLTAAAFYGLSNATYYARVRGELHGQPGGWSGVATASLPTSLTGGVSGTVSGLTWAAGEHAFMTFSDLSDEQGNSIVGVSEISSTDGSYYAMNTYGVLMPVLLVDGAGDGQFGASDAVAYLAGGDTFAPNDVTTPKDFTVPDPLPRSAGFATVNPCQNGTTCLMIAAMPGTQRIGQATLAQVPTALDGGYAAPFDLPLADAGALPSLRAIQISGSLPPPGSTVDVNVTDFNGWTVTDPLTISAQPPAVSQVTIDTSTSSATPVEPVVSWTPPSGSSAIAVTLAVSDSSGNVSTYDFAPDSHGTVQLTNLYKANTQYSLSFTSFDTNGDSSETSATYMTPAPVTNITFNPKGSLTPTVTWKVPSWVTSVDLTVTDGTTTPLTQSFTDATSYTVLAGTFDYSTKYTFTFTSHDPYNGSTTVSQDFTTDPAPVTIQSISPSGALTPTVTWSVPTGVTSVDLVVTDGTGTAVLSKSFSATQTSYPVDSGKLDYSTKYTFTLTSHDQYSGSTAVSQDFITAPPTVTDIGFNPSSPTYSATQPLVVCQVDSGPNTTEVDVAVTDVTANNTLFGNFTLTNFPNTYFVVSPALTTGDEYSFAFTVKDSFGQSGPTATQTYP